jgi:hypothetical protein
MSEPLDATSKRDDNGTDWKQLALMAIASDELARAELVRVKHELEKAQTEIDQFRARYEAKGERGLGS